MRHKHTCCGWRVGGEGEPREPWRKLVDYAAAYQCGVCVCTCDHAHEIIRVARTWLGVYAPAPGTC